MVRRWAAHGVFKKKKKESNIGVQTSTWMQIFQVAHFATATRWKQPKPVNGGMGKPNVVCPYSGKLPSHKKGWRTDTPPHG